MAYGGVEKREHERISQPFIIIFRIHQKEGSKEEHAWNMVTIRNLSIGGMCFNYLEKFALGTALEFNITLPSSLGAIRCLGEVQRIDEDLNYVIDGKEIPIYGIGVQFTDIEDDKKEALAKIIKDFSK